MLHHGLSRALLLAAVPPRHPALSADSLHVDAPGVTDADALWALGRLQRCSVTVSTPELDEAVPTSFFRAGEGSPGRRALFLHGIDSSCLEWRSTARRLSTRGVDCTAVEYATSRARTRRPLNQTRARTRRPLNHTRPPAQPPSSPSWWGGGWTERRGVTAALQRPGVEPWTCIRQHLHAFWEQEMGGVAVDLVGTSMGGAVAIDFATTHPEAVANLVLIDAGGESYAAPPPAITRALVHTGACAWLMSALALVQPRVSQAGLLGSLHRAQPGWRDAYLAYLASGGYELRVGPERIRSIRQPTLVLWGADDPVLPVADAAAFRRDLGPRCVDVVEFDGSKHSPHMDNPAAVEAALAPFLGSPREPGAGRVTPDSKHDIYKCQICECHVRDVDSLTAQPAAGPTRGMPHAPRARRRDLWGCGSAKTTGKIAKKIEYG